MTESSTLIQAVANALKEAANVNSSVQVKPFVVLWTDAEGQWESVLTRLYKECPGLMRLGHYEPDARQGPAIWLKCAVAGMTSIVAGERSPYIVYLPGVSRADLRAIETCPRDLQPLAELQYRGVFWSQSNGKDWTVSAFLASKNGGLGLNVAQDKGTQEALTRALDAGVLQGQTTEGLVGRQINEAWLNGLIQPNPTRDMLVWLNDPGAAQALWAGVRWDVFAKRCKTDFGLDPQLDGQLLAAEKLSQAKGGWAAVWELYLDSYTSFPKIAEALAKVQPPHKGLFDEWGPLAGYPRANEDAEGALRYKLAACGAMTPAQVRTAIAEMEQEHACRRDWLWAQMGMSPLARAVEPLGRLATATAQLPAGSNVELLSTSYQSNGWQADHAALMVLAAVQTKVDTDAVSAALRSLYVPWLEEVAHRFQTAVKGAGHLGARTTAATMDAQPEGLCTVFVDGLRYDVAVQLKDRLAVLGKAELQARWTSMPSVTASGKAWCSPVAHLIAGDKGDQDFEPRVAADGKPLSAHNFRKLLVENGVQALEKHEAGDPSGRAWVECGDLDHYGHQHGIRLARDLDTQLNQVIERLEELRDAGWRRFRIVTDHGWLLMPGGLPKTELPKHQAETRWGRCAVLKDSAHGTPLTFCWDWCHDVQVAYAPGIATFIAGAEYAHGGLTLQECLVPVIDLQVAGAAKPSANVTIQNVTWKGLRCIVEVSPIAPGLSVDIRTKPNQASKTLVASVKVLENGKASLAIKDDDNTGLAAVVVVLDADGNVVQKANTTVGG